MSAHEFLPYNYHLALFANNAPVSQRQGKLYVGLAIIDSYPSISDRFIRLRECTHSLYHRVELDEPRLVTGHCGSVYPFAPQSGLGVVQGYYEYCFIPTKKPIKWLNQFTDDIRSKVGSSILSWGAVIFDESNNVVTVLADRGVDGASNGGIVQYGLYGNGIAVGDAVNYFVSGNVNLADYNRLGQYFYPFSQLNEPELFANQIRTLSRAKYVLGLGSKPIAQYGFIPEIYTSGTTGGGIWQTTLSGYPLSSFYPINLNLTYKTSGEAGWYYSNYDRITNPETCNLPNLKSVTQSFDVPRQINETELSYASSWQAIRIQYQFYPGITYSETYPISRTANYIYKWGYETIEGGETVFSDAQTPFAHLINYSGVVKPCCNDSMDGYKIYKEQFIITPPTAIRGL